jgi:hypothetical protein
MKKRAFALVLGTSLLVSAQTVPGRGTDLLSRIPFSFERNAGQFDDRKVDWVATRAAYRIGLGATGAAILPAGVRMGFVGASAAAKSEAREPLPGRVNYLIGNDPKRWIRDVPTSSRVLYRDVYDGVDVAWYGSEGQLEYDLVVRPGADTGRIALRFEGAKKLLLEPGGDLRIDTASGPLTLRVPAIYQEASGIRQRIEGHYILRAENEVAFALADYDKSRQLVIDPTLVYATFFGSGYAGIAGVSLDGLGDVYIAGGCDCSVPIVNGIQSRAHSMFVAKFDPTGKTLLYSTYIGGSGSDGISSMALASDGTLAAVGTTNSTDFPLVNATQTTNTGSFVLELSPSGDSLVFSTFIAAGSSLSYTSQGVAIDNAGNAYISLAAASGPVASSIVKLSSTGSQAYTFGLYQFGVGAIAVNAQGSVYLTGGTLETTFPGNPPGAYTSNNSGGDESFVAKLKVDGSALEWATFLPEEGGINAIALAPNGTVYIAGQTFSSNLPATSGAVQTAYGGAGDGFLASLSADGMQFGFATYLGGSRIDAITSLTVTSDGNLVVAGGTGSVDFPVASGIQPVYPSARYRFQKSTDSGASFVPADSGLPSPGATVSILPDPSDPSTIVFDNGSGVYLSTDDGATWTNVFGPGSDGNTVRSLSNPSVLYLAGDDLYRSSDGGQTWNATGYDFGWGTYVLGISPSDPDTVMAFDSTGGGEFRSTDGGKTFASVTTAPGLLTGFNEVVSSSDGSMYVTGGDEQGYPHMYKSADGGLTWIELSASSWEAAFALSPSDPSILYTYDADEDVVLRSTDAGSTWKLAGSTAFTLDSLAVAPTNPQILYGADGGRVVVSTDGGATWSSAAGVESNGLNGIAINASNPAELYVSTFSAGTGFIAKLSADGKTLIWSTYYGSYDGGGPSGVAPAPGGDVWVAGSTSGSQPVTPDGRYTSPFLSTPGFLARIADATASCSYWINPSTEYSYPQGFFGDGGLVFSLTAPSGCPWTATPSDSWIHVIRNSGTGSGTIPLDVDANNTSATRTGTISIGGAAFTIIQPSQSCTYQLAQSGPDGTTIAVTAPPGCPWDVELASSDPASVTSATTGTGDGTVTISVPPNYSADELVYGLTVGGQSVGVVEGPAVTLTLAVTPSNAGSIAALSQPTYGVYVSGFPVCLKATPNSGWIFSSWSGATLGANGCFAPTSNATVTANFVPLSPTGVNNRSFVSTTGNDASSCAITAPCRTLTRALAMTDGFGEIIVLSSGDYSPATIAQPVTISAIGVDAAITQSNAGQNALTINTPGNVTITGLSLHGMGTGNDGIQVQQVGVLRLYHVTAESFKGAGVEVDGADNLSIQDSRFTDNWNGVAILNGLAQAYVRRTSLDHNTSVGLYVSSGVAIASDSSAHFNSDGFESIGSTLLVTASRSVSNGTGLSAEGASASATLQFSSCSVALNSSYAYASFSGGAVSGANPGTSLLKGATNGSLSAPTSLQ